jgi:hypothetical protein
MRRFAIGIVLLSLLSIVSRGQESNEFLPAETNVWGAKYPRVDRAGRVQIRVKAPDATKVKLNFWSGPKVDMEKQSDGFWTVTSKDCIPHSTKRRFSTCSTNRPAPITSGRLGAEISRILHRGSSKNTTWQTIEPFTVRFLN